MNASGAAIQAWRGYSAEPVMDSATHYSELWAFWIGSWQLSDSITGQRRSAPALYKNCRQLWRHADAVVSLYENFVYAGDLSTDGKPLPDGTRGAIPIDPQTGADATDEAILRGCAELWSMWRWRQSMALAPKYAAILGDCMVELVDDVGRGTVTPRFVWPGAVTDIDLSDAGDVRRYTIEYPVVVKESTAYGKTVRAESYAFRKEVDGEAIRYYRDGQPAAFPDLGIVRPVEPNPYGFAPACWFRHEIVYGVRGVGALEKTFRAALEMNSILSHALDYQRKQFNAPVGVEGGPLRGRRADDAPAAASEFGGAAADVQAAARRAAETLDLWMMQKDSKFHTVQFDVGKTAEMLGLVMDSILAEAPEARYGQQILDMTQVTAPGVERALGPIVGRVKRARANHDPQTVKLHQMALAMLGFRLANGDYPAQALRDRPARYEAFRPFDLTSYGRGLLDFTIPDREVIPATIAERVELAILQESLTTEWGMRAGGVPEDAIEETLARKEAARREMAQAFGVSRAEPEPEDGETGGNAGGPAGRGNGVESARQPAE